MHRLLVITVVLLALAATGCNDDEGDTSSSAEPEASSPPADTTPAAESPSTRALASLQRALDDRYAVTAIAPADLPQTEPLVRPARAPAAPSKLKPINGLRAELADGTTGHVFRYESKDVAHLAAPALLGRNLFHGVQGCGQTVFFSGSQGDAGEKWFADVGSRLDCDGGFAVIE